MNVKKSKSGEKLWYLISYDVRDAKRLRKVAIHLQGYGTRLQFSVFRCRLSGRELERLRWELEKIMLDEDDLLIVGLCSACVGRIRAKNKKLEDWLEKPQGYTII